MKGQKEIPVGKPYCLVGKDFLITGILDSLDRDDAYDLIKQYGGTISKSVTKKLTHVVTGIDAGESKLSKVKDNPKITIINEDGLFDLIKTSEQQSQPPIKTTKTKKSPVKTSSITTLSNDISNNKNDSISNNNNNNNEVINDLMWQDKYKPRSTRDLVGNTTSIKEINNWLTNWHKLNTTNNNNNNNKDKSTGKKSSGSSKGTEKAILISGPPGIGKTTTALLVAKEAGFSTIEFNASDTRNKTAIKEQISRLTENRSLTEFFNSEKSGIITKPKKV